MKFAALVDTGAIIFADATLVWLAGDTGVMTTDVRNFLRNRLSDVRTFEIL